MRISCNLGVLLKNRCKTLYWLQKQTNISYKTLNHYEKDRAKKYDSEIIAKICIALNCDISELLLLEKD